MVTRPALIFEALLDHVRPICVQSIGEKKKTVEACLFSTLKTYLYTFRWNQSGLFVVAIERPLSLPNVCLTS